MAFAHLPLVASGDVLYHAPARLPLHDVLTAVKHKTTVASAGDLLLPNAQRHLQTIQQRQQAFALIPDAVARTGEIVDFTIRFDNVGDQPLGNITVVDNLTTRLEYVVDSANCSVQANFLTQENDGESLVLRWEITDPLEVGQGGIIRFKCRVR